MQRNCAKIEIKSDFSDSKLKFLILVRHFFEKFCSKCWFICKILVCDCERGQLIDKKISSTVWVSTHTYVRKIFCSPCSWCQLNWNVFSLSQKVSIGSNRNWNWSVLNECVRVCVLEAILFLLTFYNLNPFAKLCSQFNNPFKFIFQIYVLFRMCLFYLQCNQRDSEVTIGKF